jgi:hypothetical protein
LLPSLLGISPAKIDFWISVFPGSRPQVKEGCRFLIWHGLFTMLGFEFPQAILSPGNLESWRNWELRLLTSPDLREA